MIPRTIHLCWISGDDYPPLIEQSIGSWGKVLVGYEVMLWDRARVESISSVWLRQAVKYKKYAFAADYIRFYALYHYGGIYLDSDVEVLQPFDDLLHLPYFVGKENSAHLFEAAVMGAEKGCPWCKTMLGYYHGRPFVDPFGRYRTQVLPWVMERQLTKFGYSFHTIQSPAEWDAAPSTINMLPVDYFSPKSWDTGEIAITPNTRTIHHFSSSWQQDPNQGPNTPYHAAKRRAKEALSALKWSIKKHLS